MSNANDLDPLRCTCGYIALRNRMSRHMHAWAADNMSTWGVDLGEERLATIAALGLTLTNGGGELYNMPHRLCVSLGGDWTTERRRVALANLVAKNQKVYPESSTTEQAR